MVKKSITILMVLVLTMSFSAISFADNQPHPDSPVHKINLKTDMNVVESDYQINGNRIEPKATFGYRLRWEIADKSKYRTKYGEWRDGPTGRGPGTLSINDSHSINRSYTASISGDYPVGEGTIGASLGVQIGESETYGTSYSVKLDDDERKTIEFRPKVQVYKVTQNFVQIDTYTGEKTVLSTDYAYVDVFHSWDYDWREGY